ncbi:MAG: cobalt-precorrin-5B (C(1))-methyltransferase CbiD [Cyanobacteria bacterium]|nr:cobalt-precorrin-5B (C(1))-methyltransferase CbiD [Cyanobacteriota bacterium]MDA0865706.1 cobalt-precorrin-5B (C(1))-methyltransferase CbiD [Cyanobacteriota bacterium]
MTAPFPQPVSPQPTLPRSGYTLPVFACASAIAALQQLLGEAPCPSSVSVHLINPGQTVEIPIEQGAQLPDGSALAITRSDPGDNLDLTRDTPIWAVVTWGNPTQAEPIHLEGGEGIGRNLESDRPAIYRYAQQLLQTNLEPLLPEGRAIRVTVILPEGRALAQRTSNAAFGIVDGLSLLGTGGIAQPLSAPGQLEQFRQTLRETAAQYGDIVFCVGENGLDLAPSLGIDPERRVKTANWIGPLLVEAALCGVKSILLVGYHGKLIKLAGGIFHTHHHVADGRQEILAAIAATQGLPQADVEHLFNAPTVEAGLTHLRHLDAQQGSQWVGTLYNALAAKIDARTGAYIQTHSDRAVTVGTALFDRARQFIAISDPARSYLSGL